MKKKKLKLRFDFISSSSLGDKDRNERIEFILNKVKTGTIIVTDAVFNPQEEMELIKQTMRKVDSGFPGIEIASLKKQTRGLESLIQGFSDRRETLRTILTRKSPEKTGLKYGITLIGPAKFIKHVKKNPDSFSIMAEV